MEERDRIDIVATLHDRFNKPADDILRKMEEMERQADDTGDAIDGMSDSLDENTDSAKKNTKATGDNTKARERQGEAIDKGAKSVDEHTRSLKGNTRALQENLKPTLRQTEALGKGAKNASQMAQGITDSAEASREGADAVQRHSRAVGDSTKKVARARDELGRFTKTVDSSSKSVKKNTKATEKNTDETAKNTKTRRKARDEWTKWDNKISKITSGLGKRFRPIGAFYQNYFKVIGAFRALLFSDIGAMIPQLITGAVALGSAFNATLAPLGRMLAGAAQIAPAMAAYASTMATVKIAIGSVTEALTLLTDGKYDETMRDDYIEQYGENTFTLAEALIEVRDAYSDLKKSVSENLFEGMAKSVKDLAMDYLPILEEKLGKTATIMNGELREGFTALQSPDKKGTIADVLDRSATASGLFVDILFSLLDVFIELSDAAGPAFLETLEALDGKLDKFSDWIRDNKDDLTDFFLSANDTAGEFFRGLGGILNGLHGISQAAEPLTDFLYGGLADRLVDWGERMNDPAAQEEMRAGYEAMIPNLEAIGNLIGSVIEGAKEIATSEYFAPLINDLADNGIPMMVEYLKALDETVGPPLLRISQALDEMDPGVLTSILAPLGDMLGLLATAMEVVLPLFSALPEPLQKVVMYGLGLVAMGLPGLFMLLLGPVGFVINNFETLSKLFDKLKKSKFGVAVGKIFKPIIEFAKKWGGKLLKPLGALGKFLGKKSFAVIPVVGTLIAVLWTVWDVIKWLWDNVEPFRNFMLGVWDWIKRAWHASIDWIVNTAVPWLVDAFWAIWDAIKAVGEWLGKFYRRYIKPVIDFLVFIGKLIFVVFGTIATIIGLVIYKIWEKVLYPFSQWLKKKYLGAMEWVGEKVVGVWNWMVDAAKWVWDKLSAGFKWLVDGIVWLWNGFVDVLKWVWNFIIDYIISPALVWLKTYAWPVIKWVIDAVVWAWNGLVDVLKWVWNFIIDYIISPALVWLKTYMWPLIKWVVDKLVGAFNWMKDKIGKAWDWIKDKIYNVYTDHIKPVFDKFKEALSALQESFRIARDAIGQIWEGLKDKVRGPAQYVIDVVYNNGIRKVWNQLADAVDLGVTLGAVNLGGGSNAGGSGGGGSKTGAMKTRAFDTGGYTGPGSKYQPAGIVHADEFVIKKVSQRDLRRKAPGFLDALNQYGSKALSMIGVPGYDGGGVVNDLLNGSSRGLGGRSLGQVASGTDGDATIDFSNPFGGMIEKFTSGLRSRFPNVGKFLDISTGMVKKMVGGATRFAGEKIAQAASYIGPGGAMKAGTAIGGALAGKISGSGWGRVASAASALGLRFTSGFRAGARTAGSGSRSLHSMGRARDYAGSASQMRAFFNAMDRPPYPTELLYTPMGARNIHRGGRRYPNSGATARNHYNHVHVGYHDGGLVPINHMRFMGGPVETWGNTLVGEFGPEIFTPFDGGPSSLLGLHGPEVMEFNREGAITPHKAVAALSEVNAAAGHHSETHESSESNHYDVRVTVGGSATEHDIEGAVYRAIAKAERKKRERR